MSTVVMYSGVGNPSVYVLHLLVNKEAALALYNISSWNSYMYREKGRNHVATTRNSCFFWSPQRFFYRPQPHGDA